MENNTKTNNRHKLSVSYLNCVNTGNTRYLDNDNPNLRQYLREVRKYKPITSEDEIKHIINYQKRVPGYEKDLEIIMGYNQRFVIMLSKRYCPTDVDICEVISEANIGMMEAINRFDVNFGVKFITYASRFVVKYIFEFLEDSGFIKQSNRGRIHGTIDHINEEFFRNNGYYPNIDEINEEFNKRGISIKDKSDFVKVYVESLDTPVFGYDDDNYINEPGEIDDFDIRVDNSIVKDNIRKLIETLPDIEKTVVKKTFGFDCQCEMTSTIANELGVSEYKVKTYLDSALKKMRMCKKMFV